MSTLAINFERTDLFKSIILGLISALFLIIISSSLEKDLAFLTYLSENKILILLSIPACLIIWVYATFKLASRKLAAFQFGKFIAVGQSNAAIDIGVLNLLILITDIDSGYSYSVFKATSFMFAVINSFFWNKFWSFQSKEKDRMGKQFVRFVTVALVGLLINVCVAHYVVNIIGPQWGLSSRIWANIGVLSSAVFSVFFDFFGFKVLVFKK